MKLHDESFEDEDDASEERFRSTVLDGLRQVLHTHTCETSDGRGIEFQDPPEYEVAGLVVDGWRQDGSDLVADVRQTNMYDLKMTFRMKRVDGEWRVAGRSLFLNGVFEPSPL